MKRPTFIEGVWVAIMASIAGAAVFTVLASFFSGGAVLRWVITGIALCYVLYLLSRSSERSGRVAVLTLWLIAVAAAWFLAPSLPLLCRVSRRHDLDYPLAVLPFQRGGFAGGSWHQRIEYGNGAVGRPANPKPVSEHLVFFPDPGPVRRRAGRHQRTTNPYPGAGNR